MKLVTDKETTLKLLAEILSEYDLFEKEGEEGGGEVEANPFAAPDDEKKADDAGADAGGGDEKKDEEGKDKQTKAPAEDALAFNFDRSAVKKYNDKAFAGNIAVPKKITKDGIIATVKPDNTDILVGFDDITE